MRRRDGGGAFAISDATTEGVESNSLRLADSVNLRAATQRLARWCPRFGQETARKMCRFQARKRSKPQRGFDKKALSRPSRGRLK